MNGETSPLSAILAIGLCGEDTCLLRISALRRDSMDIFVQNSKKIAPERADFEGYLVSHPMVQDELGLQDADLRFFANVSPDRKIAWREALSRSIDLGYGQLRMKVSA